MHLILVGFMGSGKSTLGKRISEQMGRPLIDMDARLEEKFGCSITAYVAEFGIDSFRIEEAELLIAIMKEPESVIATGGGTPCADGAIAFMREHGVVVHLSVSVPELVKRLKGNLSSRPLLADVHPDDLERVIGRNLLVRAACYGGAHAKWDNHSYDDDQLASKLSSIGWRLREAL
ncbi:MAG TPA: shikimate kinase [Flavobacteriales bacterium]|nr:shikimate kinase [Flavobacteriales bacterium]